MKTSQKIYNLYRQAVELECAINKMKSDLDGLEDAGKTASRLGDELFTMVGKAAAYEIDSENRKHQTKEQ